MVDNPLKSLQRQGQSVWLDYIRRSLITSGDLQRLIFEDGVSGVTSNPVIFEKAIAGSADYESALSAPEARTMQPQELYERIAVRDIQDAADLLLPVYERTSRRDGYVSFEVPPQLAYDTRGTVTEALRLWKLVSRRNLMIKVPATEEGIPAIRQLIAHGVNVNVTLLFSTQTYERVVEAYLMALEQRAANNLPLGGVASVASFFLSRIDSKVDSILLTRLSTARSGIQRALLLSLLGRVAIANAKYAYHCYRELFDGPRWRALAERGATTQRLLWASTATKDPAYRDVRYVEELVGPDTVNTIPPATLEAFRDHGRARASLREDVEGALDTLATLADTGISLKEIATHLLTEGVALFGQSFDKLLAAVSRRAGCRGGGKIDRQTANLPSALDSAVRERVEEWRAQDKVHRLWARDASLWTGTDEGQWLGWLGIANDQLADLDRLQRIAELAKSSGFEHALLLGMGGSSLGPDVLRATFGRQPGYPELHILDSTDPAQVRAIERAIDVERTLFIVSSKSGGTLEPNVFKDYFFERVQARVGHREAGRRFIAITDPGSKIQRIAEAEGFRRVFFGIPAIGGRYSVLSDFGLVPAAIMGIDVAKLLDRTEEMVQACMPSVPIEQNPGVMLGLVLGAAHEQGRNKLTFVLSPGIEDLGAWIEQLIAESTGKNAKGIITVDRESLAGPAAYGNDRLFVYVRLDPWPEPKQDQGVEALEAAGQPVVRIRVADIYDLGQEFFRWEIAAAVAGSVIGIHPFDQPDVEASKVATHRLTAEFERTGALPAERPFFEADGIRLFADESNGATLEAAARSASLPGYLKAHIDRLGDGDYFAVLGYMEMNPDDEEALQRIRHAVRDRKHAATCLGFGPRFLHSTGQAYKGGPNSGVFLQVTATEAEDLPVPGHRFTFGVVKAAQARGDFEVLAGRHRRALRIDLGKDLRAGLAKLDAATRQALAQ